MVRMGITVSAASAARFLRRTREALRCLQVVA